MHSTSKINDWNFFGCSVVHVNSKPTIHMNDINEACLVAYQVGTNLGGNMFPFEGLFSSTSWTIVLNFISINVYRRDLYSPFTYMVID